MRVTRGRPAAALRLFGLLGVLVGGLLSSAGDAWLDRRRQLLEGLAAARLIESEMHSLDVQIYGMTMFNVKGANELSTPVWHEHRTALAGLLASKDWRVVSGAYSMVAVAQQIQRSEGEELGPSSVETLSGIRRGFADARKPLASVSKGSSLSKPQKAMLRLTGGWPAWRMAKRLTSRARPSELLGPRPGADAGGGGWRGAVTFIR